MYVYIYIYICIYIYIYNIVQSSITHCITTYTTITLHGRAGTLSFSVALLAPGRRCLLLLLLLLLLPFFLITYHPWEAQTSVALLADVSRRVAEASAPRARLGKQTKQTIRK